MTTKVFMEKIVQDAELEEISGGADSAVAWGVGCGAIGVIITGTLSALSI